MPSFINQARTENRLKPHTKPSHEELELPRKSAKSERLETQTEVSPLAALARAAQFLAHDLRHHLSAVYVNAEFPSRPGVKPVDQEEMLSEVRLSIRCMTDQLDSLILFTRTGQMLQPRRDSFKTIIERSIQMVRSHPESQNIKISQQAMPALEGCMDGVQLCRAIYNLLLNGCQAANISLGDKSVNVGLRQNSDCVSVLVSDSGPGVPRAIRERSFSRS